MQFAQHLKQPQQGQPAGQGNSGQVLKNTKAASPPATKPCRLFSMF
jgi:hypothetical protein